LLDLQNSTRPPSYQLQKEDCRTNLHCPNLTLPEVFSPKTKACQTPGLESWSDCLWQEQPCQLTAHFARTASEGSLLGLHHWKPEVQEIPAHSWTAQFGSPGWSPHWEDPPPAWNTPPGIQIPGQAHPQAVTLPADGCKPCCHYPNTKSSGPSHPD